MILPLILLYFNISNINVIETITVLKDERIILIRWCPCIEFWIIYRRKLLGFNEMIVIRMILQMKFYEYDVFTLKCNSNRRILKWSARLDFLKVLVIIKWELFKRKIVLSSFLRFFVIQGALQGFLSVEMNLLNLANVPILKSKHETYQFRQEDLTNKELPHTVHNLLKYAHLKYFFNEICIWLTCVVILLWHFFKEERVLFFYQKHQFSTKNILKVFIKRERKFPASTKQVCNFF